MLVNYRRSRGLLLVVFVLLLWAGPAAGAASRESLTLEEAVSLALQNSAEIRKAEAEVERRELLREEAGRALDFVPAAGETYGADVEVKWRELLTADLNWQMSKKELEVARDRLALKVAQAYWNVQRAREDLELKELLEAQALRDLQKARALHASGLASYAEVRRAEVSYDQAQSSVASARNALDEAYASFNRLVGLDPGARPELPEEPDFVPLEVADLEVEVNHRLEESPSIWLAAQQVVLAEWAAEMAFFKGSYTPYKARQLELEQTRLEAERTRQLLADNIRGLYYQAKDLEGQYARAVRDVEQARQALREAEARRSAGTGTSIEVAAAAVEVARAEATLADLVRQHAYLRLLFAKPWAA